MSIRAVVIGCGLIGLSVVQPVEAAEAPPEPSATSRYALGLLDQRSRYGSFWFPEPLRAPETDIDREIRFDYFHGENHRFQTDEALFELEYNFGLLTLELGIPYVHERESSFEAASGRTVRGGSDGIGSIELAARHPVFQFVSDDNFFDYTLVGAFEVAVPSGSDISKDSELVPQLYQLFRFGEHFSVQTSIGYSAIIGPEEGGTNTLEYDVVVGCNLEHEELPLPGVERMIPLFELNGTRGLSHGSNGNNALFGTAGARFNLAPIGAAQPRIGVGYVFPIDQGARDQLDWGIITSLVFEF